MIHVTQTKRSKHEHLQMFTITMSGWDLKNLRNVLKDTNNKNEKEFRDKRVGNCRHVRDLLRAVTVTPETPRCGSK